MDKQIFVALRNPLVSLKDEEYYVLAQFFVEFKALATYVNKFLKTRTS